ncbi:hypothetical protein [Paraburkholderia terricola]|uniref:Uncharacterized protein n=2 Tax=Burkholderiaceae TaxID=119060 RepID=A0ABU1LPT4_9BURK|nr:hypothetical protein [Paraburkholderia terricola]MDR6408540.1 hypothetical protein [Paraburkholderia terricola]MDR6482921.1 hypothetical protein [Paraburkholderia terricola]
MASIAAMTHDAHDPENTPLETSPNLDAGRDADLGALSGEPVKSRAMSGCKCGNRNVNGCDKRETKQEPRRLNDKEVGNVVEGQRNMPEILSPRG